MTLHWELLQGRNGFVCFQPFITLTKSLVSNLLWMKLRINNCERLKETGYCLQCSVLIFEVQNGAEIDERKNPGLIINLHLDILVQTEPRRSLTAESRWRGASKRPPGQPVTSLDSCPSYSLSAFLFSFFLVNVLISLWHPLSLPWLIGINQEGDATIFRFLLEM